jgi:hypothetical protein
MKAKTPRFGWVDGLILSVSIASGVWLASHDWKVVEATLGLPDSEAQIEARRKTAAAQLPNLKPIPPVSRLERWRQAITNAGVVALPCLTLGAAASTFRHRQCRSRRELRHVGVLTSAVVGAFVAFLYGSELAFRWTFPYGYGSSHDPISFSAQHLSKDVGLATSALWSVLAIGGRWKATPDWPDRMGRAVGVAWVVYAVLGVVLHYAGMIIYRADGSLA